MSYLPPVVGRWAHFLFTLYVFVCVYSGVQHILCCVFVLFVFILCPILSPSLDCPYFDRLFVVRVRLCCIELLVFLLSKTFKLQINVLGFSFF